MVSSPGLIMASYSPIPAGAPHVFLYSSCKSFDRKENGLPVGKKENVEWKFESGLADLRGRKG